MDIDIIDLDFMGIPEAIASFLLRGPEGPLLIECGPATTRERLVQALDLRGLKPGDIGHVLVTHIHLDHAGAAGWWGEQGATIYVHEAGAPHLVDPSRLLASAGRIYGDQMDILWGHTQPCPAERVVAVTPGATLQVAGLEIRTLDTPGHARHHLAFALGRVAFAGDAAGVRLPHSSYVSVPAPPPEFDLEAWQGSLTRLREADLERLYLTHFGPVEQPREHMDRLEQLLIEATEYVGQRQGMEREALLQDYYRFNRERAHLSEADFQRYEKANPLFMSVDGLLRYWKKRS